MRGIIARALAQLVIGIALGCGLAVLFELGDPGELTGRFGLKVLPFVVAFVLVVGACRRRHASLARRASSAYRSAARRLNAAARDVVAVPHY